MDLSGVAAIITAITGPTALIIAARINQKVIVVEEKVIGIDHAVNGKEPGAQSMVSQVADLHERSASSEEE